MTTVRPAYAVDSITPPSESLILACQKDFDIVFWGAYIGNPSLTPTTQDLLNAHGIPVLPIARLSGRVPYRGGDAAHDFYEQMQLIHSLATDTLYDGHACPVLDVEGTPIPSVDYLMGWLECCAKLGGEGHPIVYFPNGRNYPTHALHLSAAARATGISPRVWVAWYDFGYNQSLHFPTWDAERGAVPDGCELFARQAQGNVILGGTLIDVSVFPPPAGAQ